MKKKRKVVKRKKPSLIKRLKTPTDRSRVVINPFNAISNIGLRLLANKLDDVSRAVARLLQDREDDVYVEEAAAYARGYGAGRNAGSAEARTRPGNGDMGG